MLQAMAMVIEPNVFAATRARVRRPTVRASGGKKRAPEGARRIGRETGAPAPRIEAY